MIVALGLLVAFALVAVTAWRFPGTRLCRWRADRGTGRWHCVYCGAETETGKDEPPRTCMRPTKGAP